MSKRKKSKDIDISNLMAQIEREQAEAERQGKEAIAAACEQLNALSITQVHIAYDGYGDEGSIESVYALAGEEEVRLPKALEDILADAAENLLPMGYETMTGPLANWC